MSGRLRGDDLVWYASYGSNLSRDRFSCYLAGGRPPGASRTYTGCRDTAPPAASAPVHLDLPLRFGGRSAVWGGGIAFLDPRRRVTPPRTYGRAWLLSREQVADVVAQENHVATGSVLLDPAHPDEQAVAERGPYRHVVRCGDLHGRPILTVTAAPDAVPATAPPTAAYLRTVAAGLAESHGLGADAIVDYLTTVPGVTEAWTPQSLRAVVATEGQAPVSQPGAASPGSSSVARRTRASR